jgi:arginase family enzyme
VEVFYADRQRTGAALSLDLNSTDVVITAPTTPAPEPASLTVLASGLLLAGLARRRRR